MHHLSIFDLHYLFRKLVHCIKSFTDNNHLCFAHAGKEEERRKYWADLPARSTSASFPLITWLEYLSLCFLVTVISNTAWELLRKYQYFHTINKVMWPRNWASCRFFFILKQKTELSRTAPFSFSCNRYQLFMSDKQ